MPTAYVLINCDLGSEEEIIKELKKLPEVIEVSGVYGVYDIILKIKSETMDKLRETITWHVTSSTSRRHYSDHFRMSFR